MLVAKKHLFIMKIISVSSLIPGPFAAAAVFAGGVPSRCCSSPGSCEYFSREKHAQFVIKL